MEIVAELDKGGLQPETPKSRAGRRTVAFPAELVPELRWHLERFAEHDRRGVVFIGPEGGRLRRSNFRKIWNKARMSVGLPDLHFHDYADVRVMPTSARISCSSGVKARKLSA